MAIAKIKALDEIFYKQIGIQVNSIRKRQGITLRELAKMTGLSRMTIDKLELGQGRIKRKNYDILCEKLNISADIELDVKINT